MRYEDFVIQIGPDPGGGHPVHVLKSPAGEGKGLFIPGAGASELATKIRAAGSFRESPSRTGADREIAAHTAQGDAHTTAREVGDQLFRSLFSGQVRSLYDKSLGHVGTRAGHGLRIKLKFDTSEREAAQLASLPWEFLWYLETQDFLSLSRSSPVVRYLDVPRPAAPIAVSPPLRILVAMASPRGLDPLDLDKERLSLEAACKRWKGVEVAFLERATAGSLRKALLEKRFHVLHFMGHGGFAQDSGKGVLYFESPDGSSEQVSGESLATFLKDFKTLGLVFLNACNTARASQSEANPFAGVASALVLGGLPAVLAMQFPISDRAAIAFSTEFYQRLALGDPLDAAVVEGRQAILATASETLEWGTPVLFLRVSDATVFKTSKRGGTDDGYEPAPASWWKSALAVLLIAVLGTGAVIGYLASSPKDAHETSSPAGFNMEIGREFDSSLQGLEGTLTRVAILPNGRMRMHFRFRNGSGTAQGLGLDYRSTYLADEAGNRYAVVAAEGGGASNEAAGSMIDPAGEVERWIEFPAPRDRARTFHVGLVGSAREGVQFPLFDVKLPEYPGGLSVASPPTKPTAGAHSLEFRRAIATNVAGFSSEVRGIELRDNGRMRWNFAFLNGSDRDRAVGFDYTRIYLEDEFGNRYPVLTSDTGGAPGQVYRETLQRAVRSDHWFEFSAPFNGARTFTVVLVSHDRGSLRFIPFTSRVPYYPLRYSKPVKPAPVPKVQEKPAPPPQEASPVPEPSPEPQRVEPPEETPAAAPAPEMPRKALTLTGLKVFNSSLKGLNGAVAAIERLNDGRLRWTFEFLNQSGGPVEIGFNPSETYLSDNLGHRYGVVKADFGGLALHRETLADGEKVTHWLEFPSPARGAQRFIAVLSSHSPQSLRFLPVQVELPTSAAKPPP